MSETIKYYRMLFHSVDSFFFLLLTPFCGLIIYQDENKNPERIYPFLRLLFGRLFIPSSAVINIHIYSQGSHSSLHSKREKNAGIISAPVPGSNRQNETNRIRFTIAIIHSLSHTLI